MTQIVKPLRFALVFLAATIVVAALAVAIEYFLSISIPNSATAFVPLFGAALNEGQRFAQTSAGKLTKAQAWQGARTMAIISLLVSLGLGAFCLVAFQAWALIALLSPLGWGLILGAVFVLNLIISRYFLVFGFRSQRKILDKAATKE